MVAVCVMTAHIGAHSARHPLTLRTSPDLSCGQPGCSLLPCVRSEPWWRHVTHTLWWTVCSGLRRCAERWPVSKAVTFRCPPSALDQCLRASMHPTHLGVCINAEPGSVGPGGPRFSAFPTSSQVTPHFERQELDPIGREHCEGRIPACEVQ